MVFTCIQVGFTTISWHLALKTRFTRQTKKQVLAKGENLAAIRTNQKKVHLSNFIFTKIIFVQQPGFLNAQTLYYQPGILVTLIFSMMLIQILSDSLH